MSTMALTTAAQARIDEEITKHMLAIYALRTQRNAASLISRLPAETLKIIFIHCASCHHSQDDGVLKRTPDWVNVSYVCRHWRDVALNCATLWTYLFLTSPRWTKELLARSKQELLKIRVILNPRDDGYHGLRFFNQVKSHVERAQEFHLDLSLSDQLGSHVPGIFSELSSPASHLKILKIQFRYRYDSAEWSSVLFDGHTPALNTLELGHCPVPWYLFKLSRLTTLSLRGVPVPFRQNTEEFLNTLRCLRDLRHLCLDHALASASSFLSSPAFNAFQKIDLPHLSRLFISAPPSTVITLFSCVNFPSRTELRLQCLRDSSSVGNIPSCDHYAMLASLLAQRFSVPTDETLSSPTIRSLVIQFPGQRQRTVDLVFSSSEKACHPSPPLYGVREWTCDIPFLITIDSDKSTQEHDLIRNVSGICRSMPLTHIKSVRVVEPPFSADFWRETFGHLQDLQYLILTDGKMPDLASVLSLSYIAEDTENQGTDADQDPGGIFAPALKYLMLHCIFFSDGLGTNAQSLYDALSTRQKYPCYLNMTGCRVTGEYYEKFNVFGRWQDGRFHIDQKRV